MDTSPSKQSLGGLAVAKKYGSKYMSRLGKKGRKKQLTPNTSTKGGDGSPVTV